MADYWGMAAISKRLSCSESTLKTWHRDKGFLMYRRKQAPGQFSKWYTNDNLIATWELARCQQDRSRPWLKRPAQTARSAEQSHNVRSQTGKENTGLRDMVEP